MIKTYAQFYHAQQILLCIERKLISLGINIKQGFLYYEWQKNPRIVSKVEDNTGFGYLSLSPLNSVALALAEAQERLNRFIDDDELDFINTFFGFECSKITRELISKMLNLYF